MSLQATKRQSGAPKKKETTHGSHHHHRDTKAETGLEDKMNKLSIAVLPPGVHLNLKPRKVRVKGWSEHDQIGSALQVSHMPHVGALGRSIRLATEIKFSNPPSRDNINVFTILDSGARFFLANRHIFPNQSDLNACYKRDANNNFIQFQTSFANDPSGATITGYLAEGDLSVGYGSTVNISGQRFYACGNQALLAGPFHALIGLGPELLLPAGQTTPPAEDCPTVLRTIATQKNLQLILGIYISPWNEGPELETFSGHVDFGAVDQDICSDNRELPCISGNIDKAWIWKLCGYGNLQSARDLVRKNGNTFELIGNLSAILDTGCPGIGMNERTFRAWRDTLTIYEVPYEETAVHGRTVLQIPKAYAPSLQGLILTFAEKDGGSFKIRIPAQHLVLPSKILQKIGLTPIEDHLMLITFSVTSNHDVTLGIPFYQERYVIMDCTRPDRHYAGFVKTETTEAKSPEFNTVLSDLKKAQKAAEKQGPGAGTGKRKSETSGETGQKKGKKK